MNNVSEFWSFAHTRALFTAFRDLQDDGSKWWKPVTISTAVNVHIKAMDGVDAVSISCQVVPLNLLLKRKESLQVITFDSRGVSGHFNHCALYDGIR